MADIFDLAPEGQAWTDNLSEGKAARPEDYDPTFFAGSLSAFPRGIAEGTVGLGQTALTLANQVVDSQIAAYSPAPNVNLLKLAYPGADQTMNEAYDSTAKSLEAARQYIKPDGTTQGTAAQVLNGLGQFVPAIGATVVGGPVAGGAVAFGSSFEPTRQDFLKKGVNPETATTLATEQAAFNALGMALPAAAGGRLATRLLSGVGINTSFGGLNRFAMGETLEENGYSDMAKQYRVWDGQAIAVDAVLGASFGGLHHWTATRNAAPEVTPEAQPAPATIPDDGTTVQPEPVASAGNESAAPVADVTPVESAPAPTYESRVTKLQGLADNLLPVGERKALAAEIHQAEYSLSQIEAQRRALREQPVGNSSSRRIRNRDMAELDRQTQEISTRIEPQRQALADNSRGGRFFEAKADLSRIEQGIIPESLRDVVDQTPIKPSDVDAAHVLNEGLHYDIESSPVIHASNESVNAHVSAMDAATRSLMNGEPVNISQQIRGLDGLVRPETEVTGLAMRDAMEADIRDAGLSSTPPRAEADVPPTALREGSAFSAGREESGSVSTDPDTGEVISGNSFDLMAARDLAADAETKILHPDTGQEVTLSQALADLDEQIATAQKESNVYSVAAACFLRNP